MKKFHAHKSNINDREPRLKKYNYGLAIMRLQPMHLGHTQVIGRMINECNHPILAIGSAQESRTYGNPFTYEERKKMVLNFPGYNKLTILPINDIFNLGAWAKYCLDLVEKKVKNKINVYYCGNDQDGALFLGEGRKVAINDRDTGVYKGISASKIRSWIVNGSEEWKTWVPTMNHMIVKRVYGQKNI